MKGMKGVTTRRRRIFIYSTPCDSTDGRDDEMVMRDVIEWHCIGVLLDVKMTGEMT